MLKREKSSYPENMPAISKQKGLAPAPATQLENPLYIKAS